MNVEIEIPDWMIQLSQYSIIIFCIMVIAGVLLVLYSINMRCPECGFPVFMIGLFASIFGGVGLITVIL